MANETDPIIQQAVRELAEATGVDADSVARVIHGLGFRDAERLGRLIGPDAVIGGKDLHLSVSVADGDGGLVVSY